MTAVTIVQLYPDELGVAGDRGNVLALIRRFESAGFEPEVVAYRRGDALPASADLVVVGGGPLSAMRNIHADLLSLGDTLSSWFRSGVPFFAYGSGAELLGTAITLLDGSVIGGLGLFPLQTARTPTRKVGYVTADTAFGQLVGFEDNASVWTIAGDGEVLGTITAGVGNGDGREGVLVGDSIATQMGGPLLPLNPALTDVFVRVVAGRLGVEVAQGDTRILDDYATRARGVILANARHVFSRI